MDPSNTMANAITKIATVSTIPRTINWLVKPLPVSAKPSAAAAALIPCHYALIPMAIPERIPVTR